MRSPPLIALLLVLSTAGCPRFVRDEPAESLPPSPEPVEGLASRLGPGDVFEVRVLQEPDLSGLFRVGADGHIDYPFCGRVPVLSLTAGEVAGRLRACLGDGYLRAPQVTVAEREYNSKKIMVFGYVQKPGTFVFQDRMSVVEAITLAGGFAQFASRNRVVVTRSVDGRTETHRIAVEEIGLGSRPNFFLLPGDTVYVPESAL